jgi:hypothetical protein
MFRFTVEHLGFLAKVPGLPQVFDALLLVTTALRRTPCLVAMEQIETHLRSLPELRLRPHRLGGTEFVLAGHEIAHLRAGVKTHMQLLEMIENPPPNIVQDERADASPVVITGKRTA